MASLFCALSAASTAAPGRSGLRTSFTGDAILSGSCVAPSSSCAVTGVLRIECKESRIGKAPIDVPSSVTIQLEGQSLLVKGPLGELAQSYPREVLLTRDDSGKIIVTRALDTRKARQMHGLFRFFPENGDVDVVNTEASEMIDIRTLTDNMVVGVTKGFEKKLQLIGVGYRAAIDAKDLTLNLGFSHQVRMPIPDGITVKVEDNTRLTISGRDKCAVGDFAAAIRKWRPPEPYKGKGIKYNDEVVRRKEGKVGKKK